MTIRFDLPALTILAVLSAGCAPRAGEITARDEENTRATLASAAPEAAAPSRSEEPGPTADEEESEEIKKE